jgi:hypothetical protein
MTFAERHTIRDYGCTYEWCRLHYWPRYGPDGQWYEPYPFTKNILTDHGWLNIEVYCGPGAFYPKRAEKYK